VIFRIPGLAWRLYFARESSRTSSSPSGCYRNTAIRRFQAAPCVYPISGPRHTRSPMKKSARLRTMPTTAFWKSRLKTGQAWQLVGVPQGILQRAVRLHDLIVSTIHCSALPTRSGENRPACDQSPDARAMHQLRCDPMMADHRTGRGELDLIGIGSHSKICA
jgi:hypothetical protein